MIVNTNLFVWFRGTGTAALAVSVGSNRKDAKSTQTDMSEDR